MIVYDPQGDIFQKYAVEFGGILKYLHPVCLISAIKAVHQIELILAFFGAPETMVPLTERVELKVYGMDQKILRDMVKIAVMTDASLMSAKVIFDDEITKWEDVRMLCTVDASTESNAEIYGKIISVTELESGSEALVRFTSVSAPAYKMLRELRAITLPS